MFIRSFFVQASYIIIGVQVKKMLAVLHKATVYYRTHMLFFAGLLPSKEGSLFTYQPHEAFSDINDPSFFPKISPDFESAELEQEAAELCGGDEFCLYDVLATEDLEVGNATKMMSQRREELIDLSRPSK